MAKVSSHQRIQIGSTSYLISSRPTPASSTVAPAYATTSKQPYSIQIKLGNNGAKPLISVSHASGHSTRHAERAHSPSSRYPKPPRSDVATIGSSTYLRVPTQAPHSTHANNGHSDRHYHEHKSSSPRHQAHAVLSRSPQDSSSSRRLLDVSNAANERQQHQKTSPRVERRRSIPIITAQGPSSSPQKHAHFALPHSMPNQSNMVERVPVSPQQPSRHHHTHSHESYFRHRPQGWFNRRGDQFIQKGVIKRQPQHLEWDIIFSKYPEPGAGWMDAEGHYLPHTGGILKHSPP